MQDFESLSIFLNYGVLGALVIAAAFGWIHFKPEVDRMTKQIEEQEKALTELRNQIITNALPALNRSAQVLEALPSKENDVMEEVQKMQRTMAAVLRKLGEQE